MMDVWSLTGVFEKDPKVGRTVPWRKEEKV